MTIPLVVLLIFILTVVMIMSGRGGGNFYVIILVLSGIPVHTASTTSQFILIASALSGAFIFRKARTMSLPLVLFFGVLNAAAAFVGGYQAHVFGGAALTVALSILLGIAGVAMFFPERQTSKQPAHQPGYWNITEGDATYVVNLWLAAPLTLVTGFFSGMVGISGGSFLVPLMVAGCGVPVRTAVGSATAMLAATAIAGFTGHAMHGGFDPALAIPCGIVAFVGGLIGGKFALKTKPKRLKAISGAITIVAACIMLGRALTGG